MIQTHARGGASRTGLIVALALGGASVAVIGWFVWKGTIDQDATDIDDDIPPIVDVLRGGETGGGLSLQFADKEDLSRIASKLEARELRPVETAGVVEQHLYHLEDVKAWVYLRGGETVLIEAEQGRFYMPDRRAGPESGSLLGSPKITVYTEEGIDADPLLVADFYDVLRFNLAYSHVETPGRVVVTGREIAFAGSYLTARINEQRQRIDVLEVARGESLVFTPPPRAEVHEADTEIVPSVQSYAPLDRDTTRVAPARGVNTATNSPRTNVIPVAHQDVEQAQPTPHVAHYLATFNDSVELSQGTKRLTADKLEAWARLVDHKLPDRSQQAESAQVSAGVVAQLLAAMLALQDETSVASDEQADHEAEHTLHADEFMPDAVYAQDPVVLRWTGLLRVVPLVEPNPAPLRQDDVLLRFTAVSTGMVHYSDVTTTGRAVSIDYAMTREELTLLGPGGAVRLSDENSGWIEGSKIVARLGSGNVTVVGPGQIFDAGHIASGPNRHEKSVRWIDQADFRFELDDGRMTGRIERADIAGEARAIDGKQFVTGEMLIAQFGDDEEGRRVLTQVEAYEATGSDGIDSTLAARRFIVPMNTSQGRTTPTNAFASGDVLLTQGEKSLFADVFSAQLDLDEDGKIVVGDIVGQRGVVYREGDAVEAMADRLEANGLDAVAVLLGHGDELATIMYKDSVIIGPRIELEQERERGHVIGGGRFDRETDAERIEASWTDALQFNRALGTIEILGRSRVEQTVLATGERRITEGEQISIQLARVDGAEVLDTADVTGSPLAPARAEIRRHNDAGTLVELLDLLSSEIQVRGAGSEVYVPAKGRLLVLDHRSDVAERTTTLEGWERGSALMTWEEELRVDRSLGRAVIVGDARVIQKPLNSNESSELAAATITVAFSQTEESEFEITGVLAEGIAYARFEGREIIAHLIHFDRARQMLFASGTDREPVRMRDVETGAVTQANSLSWDLDSDRIEIDRPAPIFLPRGG